MNWNTLAQIVSSALGLSGTYLLTKGDGKGWLLYAAMAVGSAAVYLQARLYGSFLVQLVFLVIQLVGFWRWLSGQSKDMRATSRRMNAREAAGTVGVWILGMASVGYFFQHRGGRLPYLDGFGATGQILGQLTMIAGHPECWIVYMVVNLTYIALNVQSKLYVFTALYCLYMSVAYRGWRQWNKEVTPPAIGRFATPRPEPDSEPELSECPDEPQRSTERREPEL